MQNNDRLKVAATGMEGNVVKFGRGFVTIRTDAGTEVTLSWQAFILVPR